MLYHWILIPLTSAFIGWFVIRITINMLFYPRRPYKILGISIQGFFPKHHQQFVTVFGEMAAQELFSFSEITGCFTHPANVQKIMPIADEQVDRFLRVRLPEQMPMIGMFIGDRTIAELKALFMAELQSLFPLVMNSYIGQLKEDMKPEQMITEKISSFFTNKLEGMLRDMMLKKMQHACIAGAVIGFVLGLLQVLLIL